jgi:hypothetical protein
MLHKAIAFVKRSIWQISSERTGMIRDFASKEQPGLLLQPGRRLNSDEYGHRKHRRGALAEF